MSFEDVDFLIGMLLGAGIVFWHWRPWMTIEQRARRANR